MSHIFIQSGGLSQHQIDAVGAPQKMGYSHGSTALSRLAAWVRRALRATAPPR